MQKTIGLVLFSLSLGGCGQAGYDADASHAFRAAWERRRAGDEQGYRAALTDLARDKHSWAGERAALDLEVADDKQVESPFARLLQQAATMFAPKSMSKLAP